MEVTEISKKLKKLYFLQLTPALFLMVLFFFFREQFTWQGVIPLHGNLFSDILIALAVLIGIAFPMFFRSFFVHKIKDKTKIPEEIFLRFEKILMTFSLITPYFLVLAIAFGMENKANIFLTILALYASYYYYPSVKKMNFEMKLFRMKPTTETKSES